MAQRHPAPAMRHLAMRRRNAGRPVVLAQEIMSGSARGTLHRQHQGVDRAGRWSCSRAEISHQAEGVLQQAVRTPGWASGGACSCSGVCERERERDAPPPRPRHGSCCWMELQQEGNSLLLRISAGCGNIGPLRPGLLWCHQMGAWQAWPWHLECDQRSGCALEEFRLSHVSSWQGLRVAA